MYNDGLISNISAQFMKKLSNAKGKLKKNVACKKNV